LRIVSALDVPSEAFTVEHFRAWSATKKLKDGSLFVLEPWQALWLEDLFAREADGRPVFDELWLIVPEGNGKTTFTSLVVLYVVAHTAEAWCPIAASARDQAVALTYRIASGFVQRNGLEAPRGPFILHPGYREIRHEDSRGAMKIYASDAASGDGVDPVGIALIEELHRLPGLDLYETWSGKLEKSDSQLGVVSTAGEPGSPFELMRERLRQEADEVTVDGCFTRAVSEGSVLHDYALPVDGDPEDLELVAAANPFSGKTVESMARKRAKKSWNLAHWRRFTCNLPTRTDAAAITEAEWLAGYEPGAEIPAGESIWAGLDLAFKWDTTALVPLWWESDDHRLLGPAEILVPPRNGNSLNPSLIEEAIEALHARTPIHTIVVDRSKAEQLCMWIEELGIEVVERAQTNSFAVADHKLFMEALRSGWLKHTGDSGLTRHVLNAVDHVLPGGDTKFERPKESRTVSMEAQERRVIDALTAAAMAHSEAAIGTDAAWVSGW